ncbi:MAG TPA: HAD family phosphatase [Deltaproteobacteria bacterium]|nr:HAD family phosphatase [Deltaproteobacteria bacterium]
MSGCRIDGVFLDFGGVIADEGFRNGLTAIARRSGIDPDAFYETARTTISTTGYLTGRATEAHYWETLRSLTGIEGDDAELREMILSRFHIRDFMIGLIEELKKASLRVAILSDQTNWLDELEERHGFFHRFEQVFNSFHLGKSKHDRSLFTDVLDAMGIAAERALFVDDTLEHVERARSVGINAIHYTGKESFLQEIRKFCPLRDYQESSIS